MLYPHFIARDGCSLFHYLSEFVWEKLIYFHNVNFDIPEIGITADLIADILSYNQYSPSNFDVYVKPGYNEKIYGSDIDVFVETSSGDYVWFALQAKVLKHNKKYTTLKHHSGDGVMQWEKLKHLEAVSGCKSFYLFYNGMVNYKYQSKDSCGMPFSETQFGCSLVEPSVIELYVNNQTKLGGNFLPPSFNDFHPANAQPWRILTCCFHDPSKFTLYSITEIVKSNPLLKKIKYQRLKNDQEEVDAPGGTNEVVPVVSNNKINEALQATGWNPAFRIVIKRR